MKNEKLITFSSITIVVLLFITALYYIQANSTKKTNKEITTIIKKHDEFSKLSEQHKAFSSRIAICTNNFKYSILDNTYFNCIKSTIKTTEELHDPKTANLIINDFYEIIIKHRKQF